MSIKLRQMTNEEFEAFCQWSMEHHATEWMEKYHMSREGAVKETKKEVAQMLPNGLRTEHNYLMTVEETDDQEPVGFIWTLHEETAGMKQSFLCDFVICESKRRKGYAVATLGLMEKHAAEAGCLESVLFVADCNHAARALYKKCGYQFLRQAEYGAYMKKQL